MQRTTPITPRIASPCRIPANCCVWARPREVITRQSLMPLYGINVDMVEVPPRSGEDAKASYVCVPAGTGRKFKMPD